jgi:hypothetical protein
VPFATDIDGYYQMVADINETIVQVNEQQYRMNAGDYQIIQIQGATMLTSNFPIQLVQIGNVRKHSRLQIMMLWL